MTIPVEMEIIRHVNVWPQGLLGYRVLDEMVQEKISMLLLPSYCL